MHNGSYKICGLCIILLSTFALFSAGCDKYTRYEILTFFFTGVPHPDEPPEVSSEVEKKRGMRDHARKQGSRPAITVYTHGPFGAGQCYLCHETATTAAFSGKQRPGYSGGKTERFDRSLPGRLVSPLKELCAECHPTKSMKSAYSRDLWIHGPVSDGMCTICHSPHQSKYPFMLQYGDSKEMCSRCHTKGFITEIEEHQRDEECTSCHNAHLGQNRFLLKKDFDEIY